jgi:hypothetical protein
VPISRSSCFIARILTKNRDRINRARVTSCAVRVTSCGLRVTSCGEGAISDFRVQIAEVKMPRGGICHEDIHHSPFPIRGSMSGFGYLSVRPGCQAGKACTESH